MARKISLVYTLALLATLCTIFAPVEANSGIANHARMIRKRAAVPAPSVPLIGVGADPNANDPNDPTDPNTPPGGTDPAGGASATGTGTAVGAGGASKTAGTSATPTNPIGGLSITIPGLGSPTGVPSASNSLSASNATLSQSSTTSLPPSSSITPSASASSSTSNSVVIATSTVGQSEDQAVASPTNTSGTSGAASGGSGHLTRNTIIAIVVVAACVGGAIIIWTVIRKWKFAPSDEFGDRLNPIDWRPTNIEKENEKAFGGDIDGTGIGHRRRGSGGSNRSFVSADAQSQQHGQGQMSDLHAHDFTAGASHLAPVGAYADLRRGPSPTPSMGDQYYGRGYGATTGPAATQQYGHNGY